MSINTKTATQLVTDVIRKLSMVPGTSVQLYAQDAILSYLQDTYDLLFKKHFWPQFTHLELMPLDGSTGTVTTDISAKIFEYGDIAAVYPENSIKPLRKPPGYYNTALITGTYPIYVEQNGDASKLFRVLPLASTGNIFVRYRTRPPVLSLGSDALIPFDTMLLVYGAAYQYAVDDGANLQQAQKFKDVFNQHYDTLTAHMTDDPIALNPSTGGEFPQEWFIDESSP